MMSEEAVGELIGSSSVSPGNDDNGDPLDENYLGGGDGLSLGEVSLQSTPSFTPGMSGQAISSSGISRTVVLVGYMLSLSSL